MLVVQIDRVYAKSLERSLACLLYIFRPTVDAALGWILGIAHVSKLGGDYDAIALSLDRSANQLLILEWAIHVRSVEHVDAELEGTMNGRSGFLLVAGAVELGHSHATEADAKRLKALSAETACLSDGDGGTHFEFLNAVRDNRLTATDAPK